MLQSFAWAALFSVMTACHALQQPASSWLPLPDPLVDSQLVGRRNMILGGGACTAAMISQSAGAEEPIETTFFSSSSRGRSVASIDSNVAIPVWPSWGGGRVVPVSLGGPQHDPFLLLAHHKHWFDPRDPLRKPFQAVGKTLGLPYVDVEGFSMHPHRGFDILTYILDGSDGFRHRDSLGQSTKVYRGGCAQWMRTGSGVWHEEFWETRNDRRTNIELFQLWVNLPGRQKFDSPHIQYIGTNTDFPWMEDSSDGVHVRDIGATLEKSLAVPLPDRSEAPVVNQRPPTSMLHVTMRPGAKWEFPVSKSYAALIYVREGSASFPSSSKTVKALQTATFRTDGDSIAISNDDDRKKDLDFLFLAGESLREPVAMGGPIVMNSEEELNDAYRQLSNGTFLRRDVALREQADTTRTRGSA